MVFCEKEVYFLASKKKIDFIRQVDPGKENENGIPPLVLLTRDKVTTWFTIGICNWQHNIHHINPSIQMYTF